MRTLRLVCVAGVFTLLASGCLHNRNSALSDPEFEEKCKPKPGPIKMVTIPVDLQGGIPPQFETVYVRTGDVIEWHLQGTQGVHKLDIELPKIRPHRFKKTNKTDLRVEVRRVGSRRICEGHEYKIKVWENGELVEGDPILIIRE